MSNFKLVKKSIKSKARLGMIATEHGTIQTPFFMPDATRAAVKGLNNKDLRNLGLQSLVVNTYHLFLQPQLPVIKKAGGVHQFMNWPGPLLSDSGGYQVYSLIHKNQHNGKITDEAVEFKSPLDGSLHKLTPENSIQIQFTLKTDMIVCLDDCPPNDLNDQNMVVAVKRTIAWADRCRAEYRRQVKKHGRQPLLFGVIQGGMNLSLRKACADGLLALGFDGYGFGARPVDAQGKFLGKVLSYTADLIPEDKLRFGLGIGTPEDIVRCARMGWDMFDCVIPTREGRHGRLFFWSGKGELNKINFYKTINITNAKFKKDFTPININSRLPELKEYSRAYLHHLLKTNEALGHRLSSLNNLEFYLDLMKKIRQGIKEYKL